MHLDERFRDELSNEVTRVPGTGQAVATLVSAGRTPPDDRPSFALGDRCIAWFELDEDPTTVADVLEISGVSSGGRWAWNG